LARTRWASIGATGSIRHCERSEAIHRAAKKVWIALSLSLLAMTADKVSPRGFNPPYGDGLTRPGDSDAGCFLAPARLHRNDRKTAQKQRPVNGCYGSEPAGLRAISR
jgi:hypothetical protein